jgi:hypothetical protein
MSEIDTDPWALAMNMRALHCPLWFGSMLGTDDVDRVLLFKVETTCTVLALPLSTSKGPRVRSSVRVST